MHPGALTRWRPLNRMTNDHYPMPSASSLGTGIGVWTLGLHWSLVIGHWSFPGHRPLANAPDEPRSRHASFQLLNCSHELFDDFRAARRGRRATLDRDLRANPPRPGGE